MTIKRKTIKEIFALSGNKCAIGNCNNPIISDESTVIGEICHIKGKKMSSARYDSNMSEDERDDIENLILLCPIHHKIIDDSPDKYTVELLYKIKKSNEKISKSGKDITENEIEKLSIPLYERKYFVGQNIIILPHRKIHKLITDIGIRYKIYSRTTGTYYPEVYNNIIDLAQEASSNVTTFAGKKESELFWFISAQAIEKMEFVLDNYEVFDIRSEPLSESKDRIFFDKNATEIDYWRIQQYIELLERFERITYNDDIYGF